MKKTNFNHRYTEISADAVRGRIQKMLAFRNGVDADNAGVKFSQGNRKTGSLVPSVSLIPIVDCGNCKTCSRGCYAIKHVCIYPSVQKQVANNSAIAHRRPEKYFADIRNEVRFRSFFRWHVQGDILDGNYFENMVRIAIDTPNCQFLAFTKMFDIVNSWIDNNGPLPANLHVIFSDWKGLEMNNRHGLPVSSPIWNDGTTGKNVTEKRTLCTGFCEECARTNTGCWSAAKGETILFEAH